MDSYLKIPALLGALTLRSVNLLLNYPSTNKTFHYSAFY